MPKGSLCECTIDAEDWLAESSSLLSCGWRDEQHGEAILTCKLVLDGGRCIGLKQTLRIRRELNELLRVYEVIVTNCLTLHLVCSVDGNRKRGLSAVPVDQLASNCSASPGIFSVLYLIPVSEQTAYALTF